MSVMNELYEDLIVGDYKAFKKFFNLHKDVVYHYALKHCKDEEVASDLVQDVFIRFWEKVNTLDSNQNVEAYLFMIAKNLVFEQFRKQAVINKYNSYYKAISTEETNSLEDIQNYQELEKLYKEAIGTLPERRRLIYELSKIENFSNQDVSDQLGVSINTVRDQLVKAGKSVKHYVKKRFTYFF